MASPSRRLAAGPTRRSLFAPIVWGGIHSDVQVTPSGRGERPERVTCHDPGFATVGVTTRRSAGRSNVLLLSNVVVADRSFERPSNKQMEPSRPTVRCYPVTNGARLICSVRRTEKDQISLRRTLEDPGQVVALGHARRSAGRVGAPSSGRCWVITAASDSAVRVVSDSGAVMVSPVRTIASVRGTRGLDRCRGFLVWP